MAFNVAQSALFSVMVLSSTRYQISTADEAKKIAHSIFYDC